MKDFPMQFLSQGEAAPGIQSTWTTSSTDHRLEISVPTEFSGPGGALSPEDLFNHALTNCFIGTFKVFADNSKLTYENLTTVSRLVVDLDENRKPVMKEFHLRARILRPGNPDKALLLAKRASTGGFILNSVKTACTFTFEVVD